MEDRPTNVFGIISLVIGLIGLFGAACSLCGLPGLCLGSIPPLLAIVAGIVGVATATEDMPTGTAKAGIALGILDGLILIVVLCLGYGSLIGLSVLGAAIDAA